VSRCLLPRLLFVTFDFRHNAVKMLQRPTAPLRITGMDTSEETFVQGEVFTLRPVVDEEKIPSTGILILNSRHLHPTHPALEMKVPRRFEVRVYFIQLRPEPRRSRLHAESIGRMEPEVSLRPHLLWPRCGHSERRNLSRVPPVRPLLHCRKYALVH